GSNAIAVSSVSKTDRMAAGGLNEGHLPRFQTLSKQGQAMSKRFVSAGFILRVVGVRGVPLAGAGLRASSGAADTPNSWGFDAANLDKTCKPCDDFYQFAMGGWMKSNPIPPEFSSWGTFTQLADKNQQNLRQILDDAVN